jgi:hypothetical protein
MASDPASLPSPAPAAPTHPCVRCGKPTTIDRGLCEECNPLGLRDASASQVHGTALLSVIAAIVLLAVVARIAVGGIGPFEAVVRDVQSSADGLNVTLDVTNRGTSAGQSTCQITDPSPTGSTAVAVVQSPRIEPGASRSFISWTTQFGSEPLPLAVVCEAP